MVIPLVTGLIGKDGATCRSSSPSGRSIERGVLVLDKAARHVRVHERARARRCSRPTAASRRRSSSPPDLARRPAADGGARQRSVQPLAGGADAGDARFWSATWRGCAAGQDAEADEGLLDALAAILADKTLEPAFIAEALAPPSEADIAREIGRDVDPDAIFRARAGAAHADRPAPQCGPDRNLQAPRPRAAPTARTPSAPAGVRSRTSASICSPRRGNSIRSGLRPSNIAQPTT